MSNQPYLPAKIFNNRSNTTPRVMVAPQRYIQGPGVIDQLDIYLSLLTVRKVGILASQRGQAAEGKRISETLRKSDIESVAALFTGECLSLIHI